MPAEAVNALLAWKLATEHFARAAADSAAADGLVEIERSAGEAVRHG